MGTTTTSSSLMFGLNDHLCVCMKKGLSELKIHICDMFLGLNTEYHSLIEKTVSTKINLIHFDLVTARKVWITGILTVWIFM